MPLKLFIKWIQNEVISLNFEEGIAKIVKISMFSYILNNFENNQPFLMFLGLF